jgi:hypothetical protein
MRGVIICHDVLQLARGGVPVAELLLDRLLTGKDRKGSAVESSRFEGINCGFKRFHIVDTATTSRMVSDIMSFLTWLRIDPWRNLRGFMTNSCGRTSGFLRFIECHIRERTFAP